MAIRLIASDLDGTLLTSDHRITNRSLESIKRAVDAGVEFIIGTGRCESECAKYYPLLKLNYGIYQNGAYVMDHVNNEEFNRKAITLADAKEVYRIFNSFDTVIYMYRDHEVHTRDDLKTNCLRFPHFNKENAPQDLPRILHADPAVIFDQGNCEIEKFHVTFITHEDAQKAFDLLSKLPVKTVWCGTYCVEVTHTEADKGAALKCLAERKGISTDEIMAIGDSGNDDTMVRAAGLGVAIGNASDSLKSIAQVIVPSNDEDGVAFAIDKYVLGNI